MITSTALSAMDKDSIPEQAKSLNAEDIRQLVGLLGEKDDTVRYHALLLLQRRSAAYGDVYPYMDDFCARLRDGNSYQRSIGAMLIAENARWDAENKVDAAIGDYLRLLDDEKPITVRQCLQALKTIIPAKPGLHGVIAQRLLAIDLSKVKETMRKSILLDILGAMAELRKLHRSDAVEAYIQSALSCGLLDRKAVREAEAVLGGAHD